jgi:hypothetical protein
MGNAAIIEHLRQMLEAEGWTCRTDADADLIARRDAITLTIEIKRVTSAGWDPLRGAFADAVLSARRVARRTQAEPVAIVAAPHVSDRMLERIAEYRRQHAPDVTWGAVDDAGRMDLVGLVNVHVAPAAGRETPVRRVNVWGDLGQWVLKVIAGNALLPDETFATSPAGIPSSEFADRIGVSRSFTWQILGQLRRDGYLDDENRLVRAADLLETWRHRRARPQVHRMTWPLPGKPPRERLLPLLLGSGRACLAGFTACHAWRAALVPEGVLDIYVRAIDLAHEHGLVTAEPGERIDVVVRVPATPEAVFRAVSVPDHDGATAADLIQCWLDLVDEPGRGHEQAEHIWRERFHLP